IGVFGDPQTAVVGDFNNDGKSDIAFARSWMYNIGMLIGTGSGSFLEPIVFPADYKGNPVLIASQDFNNDGHMDYLEKARQLGDKLIVALNTDKSISQIKGPQRPVINEYARARHMAAIQFVDIVTLFDELTPIILIEAIQPNILVKGGDYTNETIVGADFVIQHGGTVQTIPLMKGYSTTALIKSIQNDVDDNI
ncbi:unnamed protein product, partial [Adineta steineri]